MTIILLIVVTTAGRLDAQAMEIGYECPRRACSIVLSGPITAESPSKVSIFLEDISDFDTIILESPGGILSAGIEIGRMIRASGLKTQVGGRAPGIAKSEYSDLCSSACAYAFLGGVERSVYGDAKLGFHSFYMSDVYNRFVLAGRAIADAQNVASDIVFYLISMSVDARVFANASTVAAADMIYLSKDQMLEYNIITPALFSSFALEPAGNGVVAESRRQVPVRAYDELLKVKAYCQDGTPYILFDSNVATLPVTDLSIYLNRNSEEPDVYVDEAQIDVISDGERSSIRVRLTQDHVRILENSNFVETSFDIPPIDGGPQAFSLAIDESGRENLSAAFRLCI
ncbi:hypothetical protein [uncultured Hoeflea sp.]|uniref:COG3904 family protein n=1 Tax=uncultured Hoeflea sp. TaxID=538666 RepID=UPI002609678E|nr:hypothetical protein [uncultured Hoeflea sp.]